MGKNTGRVRHTKHTVLLFYKRGILGGVFFVFTENNRKPKSFVGSRVKSVVDENENPVDTDE